MKTYNTKFIAAIFAIAKYKGKSQLKGVKDRTVGGDRTVVNLDYSGGGYMTTDVCQNSQNYTLKRVSFPLCKV